MNFVDHHEKLRTDEIKFILDLRRVESGHDIGLGAFVFLDLEEIHDMVRGFMGHSDRTFRPNNHYKVETDKKESRRMIALVGPNETVTADEVFLCELEAKLREFLNGKA